MATLTDYLQTVEKREVAVGLGTIVVVYFLSGWLKKKIGHQKHRKIAQKRLQQREKEFREIEQFKLVRFIPHLIL